MCGDPLLRMGRGVPDVVLLCQDGGGKKCHAHSQVLDLHCASVAARVKAARQSPHEGNAVMLRHSTGECVTLACLRALLAAMYCGVLPPVDLFDQVADIAAFSGMDLVMQTLRHGVVVSCDLSYLSAIEHDVIRGPAAKDAVLHAFACFAVDEFEALDGYAGLGVATKAMVSQRRVALLDQLLCTHPALRACREGCPRLFRRCPASLRCADLEAGHEAEVAAGSPALDMSGISFASSGAVTPSAPPARRLAGSGRCASLGLVIQPGAVAAAARSAPLSETPTGTPLAWAGGTVVPLGARRPRLASAGGAAPRR